MCIVAGDLDSNLARTAARYKVDSALLVLAFFFIVFAGAILLLVHWLEPNSGWQLYTTILAGSSYATWLLRKFRKRG